MDWLMQLFVGHSVAQSVVVLSLTIVLGVALGSIRIFSIRIGVGGILFSAIFLNCLGLRLDPYVMDFMVNFGLILFLFSIGLEVGPSFLGSLRSYGMSLNILAALMVFFSALVTVVLWYIFDLPISAAVGIYSGAVSNIPALAAASQALVEVLPGDAGVQAVEQARVGCILAYPFGVIGVILSMVVLRAVFKVDVANEAALLAESMKSPSLMGRTLRVENPSLVGRKLQDLEALNSPGFVISRVKEAGESGAMLAPKPDIVLERGMLVHAVGNEHALELLQMFVGSPTEMDLSKEPGPLDVRYVRVTQDKVVGKTLHDLGLTPQFGVSVSRIRRAGLELPPHEGMPLHFGDKLTVVSDKAGLEHAEEVLGNSKKAMNQPHILPLFLGILLGTIVGSIPLVIPGLPAGLRLGLPGGALLVAIILGHLHCVGRVFWYLPEGANLVLREMGIVLFLACVGLSAGDGFLEALCRGEGLQWIGVGALMTLIPVFIVACIARYGMHCNYVSMCGMISGSMTNPPALSFAQHAIRSTGVTIACATVYPAAMFLRILSGQLLVLFMDLLK